MRQSSTVYSYWCKLQDSLIHLPLQMRTFIVIVVLLCITDSQIEGCNTAKYECQATCRQTQTKCTRTDLAKLICQSAATTARNALFEIRQTRVKPVYAGLIAGLTTVGVSALLQRTANMCRNTLSHNLYKQMQHQLDIIVPGANAYLRLIGWRHTTLL